MSATLTKESFATPKPALLDRERFASLARRAGLDAVVLSAPLNVYYATNAISVCSRFSQRSTVTAIVPANMSQPIVLIADGVEFYNELAVGGTAANIEIRLVGKNTEPKPAEQQLPAVCGAMPFDAREQRKRQATMSFGTIHPGTIATLSRVLIDYQLERATIGVDAHDAQQRTLSAAPQATVQAADDFMLHLRMVKTPAELMLIRQAAAANVAAGIATINAVRDCGSIRPLRQRFFAEAARHGNVGVYGNIDMVVNELGDGELREGQGFMVDFVSHYGFYQGDFARTIFLGEPNRELKRAAEVGVQAWQEIRSQLRPGISFSAIQALGVSTVKKLNAPFEYAFSSHGVGLQHWDHPIATLQGAPIDNVLEAGMVLSVDCPLLGPGVNGSTHFEDLVVITATGCETLHPEVPAVFVM